MGQTETKVTMHLYRHHVRIYPYRPHYETPDELVDINTLPQWVQEAIAVLDMMPEMHVVPGVGHRWRTRFSRHPNNWAYHIERTK